MKPLELYMLDIKDDAVSDRENKEICAYYRLGVDKRGRIFIVFEAPIHSMAFISYEPTGVKEIDKQHGRDVKWIYPECPECGHNMDTDDDGTWCSYCGFNDELANIAEEL